MSIRRTITNISRDELEAMLHKGMGRAIIYLKDKDLTEYRDLILDNCLHNRAYDVQCEDNRAEYLYPLISQSADAKFYRDEIIKALGEENDDYSFYQIFDLARLYALDGDEFARLAMYERFERRVAEDSTGAGAIISVDGVEGLLYVIQQLDKYANDKFVEDCCYYIRNAEDQLSVAGVSQALKDAAEDNSFIADILYKLEPEYSPYWSPEEIDRRREEKRERLFADLDDVEDMDWEEVKNHKSFSRMAVRWARLAPYSEFVKAAEDFLVEDDIEQITVYLKMYQICPFPLHPQKLIDLVSSPSLKITSKALNALAIIKHDDVRSLFQQLYNDSEWAYMSAKLLRQNYMDDDYKLIDALVKRETDPDRLHRMLFDVQDVYKDNPVQEAIGSLMQAYEKNPCSFCRYFVFKSINELDAVPDWMIEECFYDVDKGTRLLAREMKATRGCS